MHPKDLIPDAQKTDIIYHWKCPANNCTVEYIGEINRSLKERVSDHRNQMTSAIRNHHISIKHPKVDFTIIERERERERERKRERERERESNTLQHKKHFTFVSKIHHSTETLAKSDAFSIQQTSQTSHTTWRAKWITPHPRGGIFFTWSFNTKDN